MPYITDPGEEAPSEQWARYLIIILKTSAATLLVILILGILTVGLYLLTKEYAPVNDYSREIQEWFLRIFGLIF